MSSLKGQNLRVFLGNAVIAEATNCTINLTGNTEDTSTKDTVSMASAPSVVSKSWQVTVESLNVNDLTGLLNAIKSGTVFTLSWDETDTSDNTSPESASFKRTGSAYLTDLNVTFNDREWSAKQCQFTGSGALS